MVVLAKASSDCQLQMGRLPRRQASQALAISLEELGISRRVLDDSCALDPTKGLKRFSWPKTNSEPFLELGLRRGQ